MTNYDFSPFELPHHVRQLRSEVRAFLKEALVGYTPVQRAHTWTGFDSEFSRKLGQQGWIGMTWPKKYGGHERSALERYVVVEELLAAGAPVAAHWIADRQSGPQILRFGTETARQRFIPAVAKGELYFCIGMSEPNSGSDLASISTHATRTDGGWLINGSKVWTTIVQHAHVMITLVRTGKDENNRHAGLSQFLIDLKSPGVTRNGITDHTGEVHFGEVFLDNVFVSDDMLLGQLGDGWAQVNAELALERSGPERYLSSYQLYEKFLGAIQEKPSELELNLAGNIAAELWTLRQMSLSVTGKLANDKSAILEATIVKDLGACFEQQLPHNIQAALNTENNSPASQSTAEVLSYLLKASPSFSLRGGTREILRGIISKGLGLR
ncbi:acyl-CoA dehydrogenase family protein [Zhongshania borealis]|uniref:Acyl-CoA dehydrogenase family protein n=1 Tax=Zhongshania borealis TaxID=889488 RepID=A0ABP7X1N7_9GAMM